MIPFVDRAPSPEELEQLRLALSTFGDGTGWERDKSGGTLPGWRQIERAVAEVLEGQALESKAVFDIIVQDRADPGVYVGVSVKSKELSALQFDRLDQGSRLYLELSNSPALLWAGILTQTGFVDGHFRRGENANEVGQAVLATVASWHEEFAEAFRRAGKKLDLARCIYLVLTSRAGNPKTFRWHSLSLPFPANLQWAYRPGRGTNGCRSVYAREVGATDNVLDWYGLSGGQLKYYPAGDSDIIKYSSPAFCLASLPAASGIRERAAQYWPGAWVQAGGELIVDVNQLRDQLQAYAAAVSDRQLSSALMKAAEALRYQNES